MKKGLLLAFTCAFGYANSAMALACPPAPTSTLTSVTYDPQATSDTIVDFSASILPMGEYRYNYAPYRQIDIFKQNFGLETDGNAGAHVISYNFSQLSGPLSEFMTWYSDNMGWLGNPWRGGANDKMRYLARAMFPYNATATQNFRLQIPKNQNIAPGTYTIGYFMVGYWHELYGSYTCPYWGGAGQGSARSFNLVVLPAMSISMSGGGVSGDINFDSQGGLTTNATRSTNIRVRSNAPYKISLSSANNGTLNLNNDKAATEKITYEARLNNILISKDAPYVVTNPNGTSGINSDIPFEVKIGNTNNSRAGFYKDIVTLTIGSTP